MRERERERDTHTGMSTQHRSMGIFYVSRCRCWVFLKDFHVHVSFVVSFRCFVHHDHVVVHDVVVGGDDDVFTKI